MPVVTVTDHNDPRLDDGGILTKVEEKAGINMRDIVPNPKGWAIHLGDDIDRERLLNGDVRTTLFRQDAIEVIKPPDYKANCTVIITGTPFIHDLEIVPKDVMAKYIKDAIQVHVVDRKTISPYTMKLECHTPEQAQKLINSCLVIGDQELGPESMTVQKYIKVSQCVRCFAYDHERLECLEPISCFYCGDEGHTNLSCPTSNEPPRCKNCGQEHVAIAFKCPVRKAKLAELERIQMQTMIKQVMANIEEQQRQAADGKREEEEGATALSIAPSSSTSNTTDYVTSRHASRECTDNDIGDNASEFSNDLPEERQILMRALAKSRLEECRRSFHRTNPVSESHPPPAATVSVRCPSSQVVTTTLAPHPSRTTTVSVRQPPPAATTSVRRPSRVLRAPNPQNGEGPRRIVRRIPNYVSTVNNRDVKPSVILEFPVLPKKQFRCVQAAS